MLSQSNPARCFVAGRELIFPAVMGVVNTTPDSFSDGGEFVHMDSALQHFQQMVDEGATIIDIGGESTRPGHRPVPIDKEIARVVPFIERIRPLSDALISIDTSKSAVADAALHAGADIVNDVWGAQRDPQMAAVIAKHDAACILMHNRTAEQAQAQLAPEVNA